MSRGNTSIGGSQCEASGGRIAEKDNSPMDVVYAARARRYSSCRAAG